MGAVDRSAPGGRLVLDAVLAAATAVLVVVTVAVIQEPARGSLGTNLAAQMVISTAMTVASWLLAVLAWLRWRELRTVALQFESAAFATLGLVNVYFLAIALREAGQPVQDSTPAAILAFSTGRLIFGGLLLAGGLAALRGVPRIPTRLRAALFLGPVLFAGLVLLGAVSPGVWTSPDAAPLLDGWTPDNPVAALVHAAIAGVVAAGALVYRRLYLVQPQPGHAALAVALLVAAFAQVHFALVPGVYSALITSEEILRIAMYGLLLAGTAIQAGVDVRRIVRADRDLERLRQIELERQALEDRERLAREIHDGIAQDLWLTKLAYGQLRAQLPSDRDLARLADDVDQALGEAIAGTRQAISWIQSATESESPFGEALAHVAAEFSERFGLRVAVAADEVPALDAGVQVELLRIAQEALRNVLKHAGAREARVTLRYAEGRLELAVEDDGRGFEIDDVPLGTFGLMTMSRRAEVIGARLGVRSRLGTGTRVAVVLKLPTPSPQGAGPPAGQPAVELGADAVRDRAAAARHATEPRNVAGA